MKSQVTNTRRPRPILENQGLAVVRVVAVIGCVANLLFLSGPSAIGRRAGSDAMVASPASVASISVDAVDGVLGSWGRTHIVNESLNVVSPSIADVPAKPAVKGVIVGGFGVAANHHVGPNPVLSLAGKPMLLIGPTSAFGAGVSDEVVGAKASIHSAFNAANKPVPSTGTVHFRGQQQQRAYDIARLNITGAKASLLVSHDVTLPNRVALRLGPTGVSAPARLVLFYDSAGVFSTGGAA